MIKKFKEYNESASNKKDISELTKEELEDQFLRLKEVLNASIDITPNYKRENALFTIYITSRVGSGKIYDLSNTPGEKERIEDESELRNIKNRLMNMFPINVRILKTGYYNNNYPVYRIEIDKSGYNHKPMPYGYTGEV